MPYTEATSVALLLEILYTQLQVPGDKQITLEKIILVLDALKEPRLILLNNFEMPWNVPGGTQNQVSNILRKLARLNHVGILVTMHGAYPPCDAIEWQSHIIQPTDEAACHRIFHDINPSSKNGPDVDCLLAALGHMPFAVTLMANLGKRGKSNAKELLEMWYASGTDMLSVTKSPEKSMNRSISLSVNSELVKQDPDALLLLAILSLLPAGTTKQNLRWWATSIKMIPSAIATLSDAGLLVEDEWENSTSPVLSVVPVVQSFMRQQDRVTEEIQKQTHLSCCEYVLAHACCFDDPTFPKNSKALAAEDANIQSILFGSPLSQPTVLSNRTIDALVAFSWHHCDTKPALDIANHAVTVARASGLEDCIASAVWCLGKTYAELGDHHSSYDHLREAYKLFNTIAPGDVELQRLSGQCGIDLVDTVRMLLEDTDEIISLAQDVKKKCATLSDIIHGRSLVLLDTVFQEAQQPQEALRHLNCARTMLKPMGSTPSLAYAFQAISWVHYYKGGFLEALGTIEQAWKHAQMTENASIQADIALDLSQILFSTNKDTKAREYIEISLSKAIYIGNQLQAAQALDYMGYGYLHRGDYQNAYDAYKTAAQKFVGTVWAQVTKKCEENMARIKTKEENPDVLIGFHRPATDFDSEILFYLP